MGKSRSSWIRLSLSAIPLVCLTAPAFAQTAGLLGDIGGVRTALGNHGITFGLTDSENLLGNTTGGIKQGATMQGVATGTITLDTSKAFGLQGGTFYVSALQIHGQPLSPSYLGSLQAANGNEAEDATRLWELWYDQQFGQTFDVKIGQQSIDNEFMTSANSSLFVNTMAGWPLIPSDDLYGGGPAYPLSSPGLRLRGEPMSNITLLAGVFDDNPGGGQFDDDAQYLDRNGAKFNLNTGALFIAEAQYATNFDKLPGDYKLGGWYDSGSFPDQRYGTDGIALNSPDSNASPAMHHGNYSIYAVADQTVWQGNDGKTLNVFARIMGAPAAQNLISLSVNCGATFAAPFKSRPNDVAGINFGLGKVSSRAADADRDIGNFSESNYPVRGTEESIEVTYQAAATPWLVLQPDLQYIVNPGAGVQDPNDATHLLRNELVVGARAIVTF